MLVKNRLTTTDHDNLRSSHLSSDIDRLTDRSALRAMFLSISAPLRIYLGYTRTYLAPVSAPNGGECEKCKRSLTVIFRKFLLPIILLCRPGDCFLWWHLAGNSDKRLILVENWKTLNYLQQVSFKTTMADPDLKLDFLLPARN